MEKPTYLNGDIPDNGTPDNGTPDNNEGAVQFAVSNLSSTGRDYTLGYNRDDDYVYIREAYDQDTTTGPLSPLATMLGIQHEFDIYARSDKVNSVTTAQARRNFEQLEEQARNYSKEEDPTYMRADRYAAQFEEDEEAPDSFFGQLQQAAGTAYNEFTKQRFPFNETPQGHFVRVERENPRLRRKPRIRSLVGALANIGGQQMGASPEFLDQIGLGYSDPRANDR